MKTDLFEKCIVRKSGDGWYQIDCKLGLFGVTGPDKQSVEDEAMHYFGQYLEDGEYAALTTPNPTTKP